MGNPHETAAAAIAAAAAAVVEAVVVAAVAVVEAASAAVVGKGLYQESWVGPWMPSRCAAIDSYLLGSWHGRA